MADTATQQEVSSDVRLSGLTGIAAAAMALGVAQLAAVPLGPAADSRTAIGSSVIDLTPGPVKEWAIQLFGTSDKLALSIVVLVVIGMIAALTAQRETRRRPVGSVAIAVAGLLGCIAVVNRAGASPIDVLPTVFGTVCGVMVLRLLVSDRFDRAPDPGRRRSLVTVGFLGIGVVAGVAGAVLTRLNASVAGDRTAFALPTPRGTAPPAPPPGVQPPGFTQTPFLTPSADFYRIDTALSVPQLSRADWRLRIHGMVDHEVTLTFDDLQRFDLVEEYVTLTCVSNPVGGDLISNAKWTGYRVRDLLTQAGIHSDADMVLSTSIDGFTAGTPVEALTDERGSLLAIGMNDAPLPTEHGYPARLVVPGLYGYVSATKWLVDLELTRFDRAQAYWTKLGWSPRGPIKTESRIDVPRSGAAVPKGPTTFGGVAWAQQRGISAVEVRIDDGPWQPAQLGDAYSKDTWRLWSFPWQAEASGSHTITVRATDGTGAVQTQDQADVVPDGATGWDSVEFSVT